MIPEWKPYRFNGEWRCPKGHPMEERHGSMHWRGRFFAGLVCDSCGSLWDNPNDSMIAYANETRSQMGGPK